MLQFPPARSNLQDPGRLVTDSTLSASHRRFLPLWLPVAVILILAAAAAAVAYGVIALHGGHQSPASERLTSLVGRPAPAFSLQDLDGRTVTLADASGKPLLINTWATWCVPCREEMPAIQRAYEAHQSAGLRVLAVDALEDAASVRAFESKFHLSLPAVIDSGSFQKAYGVVGLPSSFFVDRHGIVRAVQLGQMNEQTLSAKLDLILGPVSTA